MCAAAARISRQVRLKSLISQHRIIPRDNSLVDEWVREFGDTIIMNSIPGSAVYAWN